MPYDDTWQVKDDWLASNWSGMLPPNVEAKFHDTGVELETLQKVGTALTKLPESFSPHRMVGKIYQARNDVHALLRGSNPRPSSITFHHLPNIPPLTLP